MTCTDAIILAAHRMSETMGPNLNVFDLTIAAWRVAPRSVGLSGYEPEHPDHHKVVGHLCKSLIPRGLFARVGPNYLQMTPAGHAAGRRIELVAEAESQRMRQLANGKKK